MNDPATVGGIAVGAAAAGAAILKVIDVIRGMGKGESNGNGKNGNGNGHNHGEGEWATRHDDVVKAVGSCVGKIDSLEKSIAGYTEATQQLTQRLFDKLEEHDRRITTMEVTR